MALIFAQVAVSPYSGCAVRTKRAARCVFSSKGWKSRTGPVAGNLSEKELLFFVFTSCYLLQKNEKKREKGCWVTEAYVCDDVRLSGSFFRSSFRYFKIQFTPRRLLSLSVLLLFGGSLAKHLCAVPRTICQWKKPVIVMLLIKE